MIDSFKLEVQLLFAFVSLRVVGPQNFNELSVTTGCGWRHHHTVERSVPCAMSLQANLNHSSYRKEFAENSNKRKKKLKISRVVNAKGGFETR